MGYEWLSGGPGKNIMKRNAFKFDLKTGQSTNLLVIKKYNNIVSS